MSKHSSKKTSRQSSGTILPWINGIVQNISAIFSTRPGSNYKSVFGPYEPLETLRPVSGESLNWVESKPVEVNDQVLARPTSYAYLKTAIILICLGVLFRLVFLQITHSQNYVTEAKGNSQVVQYNPAPRGLIYDSSGAPLVSNTPSFSVVFETSQFPTDKASQQAYINKLAPIIGMSISDLTSKIKSSLSQNEVTLASNLTRDQGMALQLKLDNFPGIYLQQVPVRQYADVADIGHILGYTGQASASDLQKNQSLLPDSVVGKTGIEAQYDNLLQGQPSVETLEVDSQGQIVRSIGSTPAVPGDSVYLTLDSSLQNETVSALQQAISLNKATSGAAVVMDVNTGAVLAMASIPTYNANIFSDPSQSAALQQVLNDPLSPLLNRAIAGQYPSGSTIKPVYATGALEDGVITKNTLINTSAGKITVGGTTFSDWAVHGITNVALALAQSNDVFFYEIGGGYGSQPGLGVSRLDQWLDKFGFGSLTGIDLPGEEPGLVPTPAWMEATENQTWYLGNTYNLSIGQGDLLVTPLQLTRAISAIANGGKLLTPHLLKDYVDSNGNVITYQTKVDTSQVASSDNLATVRQGMLEADEPGGSAYFELGKNLPFQVGAKTGTAQISQSLTDTHAWFTMFAPYNNPQIAISIIVEGGGEGFDVSGPVARAITESYYHLPITPITAAPPGG